MSLPNAVGRSYGSSARGCGAARLLPPALIASLFLGAAAPAATRDGGLLAALGRFRIALGEAPLPEFPAVALDLRARIVGASVRPGRAVSAAVGVNAAAPFPVLVVPKRLDPGSPLEPTVIAPGPVGAVRLTEWRAGTPVELRTKVALARGVGGAQAALIDAPGGDGLRLAYGLRYRLLLGGRVFAFRTAPLPAAYHEGGS